MRDVRNAAAELFRILAAQDKDGRAVVLPKNTNCPALEPENWQQKLAENPGFIRKVKPKNGHRTNP